MDKRWIRLYILNDTIETACVTGIAAVDKLLDKCGAQKSINIESDLMWTDCYIARMGRFEKGFYYFIGMLIWIDLQVQRLPKPLITIHNFFRNVIIVYLMIGPIMFAHITYIVYHRLHEVVVTYRSKTITSMRRRK